jgi:hypothetical protein
MRNEGALSAEIGIFRGGTPPADALAETGIVAGASTDTGSFNVSGSTGSATLYIQPSVVPLRWTNYGTYDVYLRLEDNSSNVTYYGKTGVNFVSALTAFSAAELQPVSP